MKKLLPSLVAVKRVTSNVPATNFNRADLETAARTSLELGGFIQPLVVRRTGTELNLTYEVVSGHFQYHAACIARDIDFLAGETVVAYIMEPETEAPITQQLDIIPSNAPTVSEPTATEAPATPAPTAETPTLQAPATPATSAIAALEKAFSLPRLALDLAQLKQLAKAKGVRVKGDKRKKTTYIEALKLALA
jgi:hypothetical protein